MLRVFKLLMPIAGLCWLPISLSAVETAVNSVKIIAHRGASFEAPENTLSALRLGFEQANDGCELDVWISSDGVPVVIHDGDTKRVAGENRKVAEQSLVQLQALDVGRWKDEKFAGERIPKLVDALALVPSGKRMFVEIKCDTKGLPAILAAVEQAKLEPAQTAIISFSADVVAAAKKARPDLQVYWIVSVKKDGGPSIVDLIAKAKTLGVDGLDLSDSPRIDAVAAEKIHAAKLSLYVWTVDNPSAAQRLVALGVEGITTNRPGWLQEQLAK